VHLSPPTRIARAIERAPTVSLYLWPPIVTVDRERRRENNAAAGAARFGRGVAGSAGIRTPCGASATVATPIERAAQRELRREQNAGGKRAAPGRIFAAAIRPESGTGRLTVEGPKPPRRIGSHSWLPALARDV
jgi:hypothetical protein